MLQTSMNNYLEIKKKKRGYGTVYCFSGDIAAPQGQTLRQHCPQLADITSELY